MGNLAANRLPCKGILHIRAVFGIPLALVLPAIVAEVPIKIMPYNRLHSKSWQPRRDSCTARETRACLRDKWQESHLTTCFDIAFLLRESLEEAVAKRDADGSGCT